MTNLHRANKTWTKGLVAFVITLAVFMPSGCSTRHAKAPAPAATKVAVFDVDIYRGVDANPNSGLASLAPGQFRFNPTLSTFLLPAQAPVLKACNYRFHLTDVAHDPPQTNDTGNVTGLPGYIATYDDNPPGHWGIQQPNGVTPDEAKAAVSAYALLNRGNVVNGTQNNCN
jgi:hypothetical protein